MLVHAGYYNRIVKTVAYKQQKFTTHSSGGRKVQDQGAGRFSVL